MSTSSRALALVAAASSLVIAHPVRAIGGGAAPIEQAQMQTPAEDPDVEAQAAPAESPPAEPVPAPPSVTPPAPPAQPQPAPADTPPGQWVYTSQYDWVWMPYANRYTWVPPGGWGEPCMYVYGPAFGWTWVVAPWVWGFGPWPFFGVTGPVHFGWWGHGWWRSPWRWQLVPAPNRPAFVRAPPGFTHRSPGYVHGPGFRSGSGPMRSAPPRAGWGPRARR